MSSNSISPEKLPDDSIDDDFNAVDTVYLIKTMLHKILKKEPAENCTKCSNQMTDLTARPKIWVSMCYDYLEFLVYHLSNGTVGVSFKDGISWIMLPNGFDIHYVDLHARTFRMTKDRYPAAFESKIQQLIYFSRFIKENLAKADASKIIIPANSSSATSKTPYLHMWWRSNLDIFMLLDNGTLQVDYNDQTKVIICPNTAAVTYIDEDNLFRTHRFTQLEQNGCYVDLHVKLLLIYDSLLPNRRL